jgi:hypothetical protein
MVLGNIDFMFSQLASVPTWASMIGGFFIVLAVIFLGVIAFGKNRAELGAFGISMLAFFGVLLATMVGLFPMYIILVFVIVSLLAVVLKAIFGGVTNGQ